MKCVEFHEGVSRWELWERKKGRMLSTLPVAQTGRSTSEHWIGIGRVGDGRGRASKRRRGLIAAALPCSSISIISETSSSFLSRNQVRWMFHSVISRLFAKKWPILNYMSYRFFPLDRNGRWRVINRTQLTTRGGTHEFEWEKIDTTPVVRFVSTLNSARF